MKYDQEKLEKLFLVSTLRKPSEVELLKHVDRVEKKIGSQVDTKLKDLQSELESKITTIKDSLPDTEEIANSIRIPEDGYTPIKGVDYFDGTDYVLTDEDKQAIAQKIKVPVVEKVVQTIVEKTEVIKEQPIVTQQITNEIKEVAITESPEQIVSKVNLSRTLIEPTQVKGLADIERMAKNNQVAMPVTTTLFFQNGQLIGRAKNINVTNATVSVQGDIATITPTTVTPNNLGMVIGEIPLAVNSGSDCLLTLDNVPTQIAVYRNGQRLFPTTDYTLSSNNVTVLNSDTSSVYLVDYSIDTSVATSNMLTETDANLLAENGDNLII